MQCTSSPYPWGNHAQTDKWTCHDIGRMERGVSYVIPFADGASSGKSRERQPCKNAVLEVLGKSPPQGLIHGRHIGRVRLHLSRPCHSRPLIVPLVIRQWGRCYLRLPATGQRRPPMATAAFQIHSVWRATHYYAAELLVQFAILCTIPILFFSSQQPPQLYALSSPSLLRHSSGTPPAIATSPHGNKTHAKPTLLHRLTQKKKKPQCRVKQKTSSSCPHIQKFPPPHLSPRFLDGNQDQTSGSRNPTQISYMKT